MKIILSRKGFDSERGAYPSPIMPDGSLISLPIPQKNDKIKYRDLNHSENLSYFDIMKQLRTWIKTPENKEKLTPNTTCHLDPDLNKDVLPRPTGWKPIFGQINAAQTHLYNKGIGEGDLFLFFGTFRRTGYDEERNLQFKPDASEIHLIFGYLQVGKVMRLDQNIQIPKWMRYHPHTDSNRLSEDNNTIYVAKDKLTFDHSKSGGGVFSFDEELVLTKNGKSKSRWNLDPIFKEVNISYHSEKNWKDDYFQSTHRGQEFVIECNHEVEQYIIDLVKSQ